MHSSHQNVSVITIDGPSGTGKGTVAQRLAQYLQWHYLDSGAIYRVLAWAVHRQKLALDDINSLVALADRLNLSFKINQQSVCLALLDGVDISAEIRTENCGLNASKIAAIAEIRTALLSRQRAFAIKPGLVTDGRDMGTVVFPDARLKFFLYASVQERARRRLLQLKKNQNDASLAQVVNLLVERDARDSERDVSPLKPADDAIHIDTTDLSIDQVFERVVQEVENKLFLH